MQSSSKYLIVVSGPTAVGKTAIVNQLVREYGGPLIYADSRQIYKELDIGTAKPGDEELMHIEHHFINHVNITDRYTAGIYEQEALQLIDGLFKERDVLILTGGSGFYIRAVCEGFDQLPEIPSHITQQLETEWEDHGLQQLVAELKSKDPDHAEKADLNNPRRVIRALSVIRATQKTYSSFRRQEPSKRNFNIIYLALSRDRKELYERIDRRVDKMIEAGLVEEVQNLKPHWHLRSMATVGYKEIIAHLNGQYDLEEAVRLIKRNTRRYAKRQLTWLRNQGQWQLLPADDLDGIRLYINEHLNI